MNQRRVDPIRQQSPLIGHKRRALQHDYDQLNRQITELDQQISQLGRQRHQLHLQRRALHHRLWINLAKLGRRAAPNGREAIPPAPHNATPLWGRRLRAHCRHILKQHGTLPLTELHAELHRTGYTIASQHPVKTLADALGHDTDQGHVERVTRGTYRLRA